MASRRQLEKLADAADRRTKIIEGGVINTPLCDWTLFETVSEAREETGCTSAGIRRSCALKTRTRSKSTTWLYEFRWVNVDPLYTLVPRSKWIKTTEQPV